MFVKRLLIAIVFLLGHARADEGMWMPEQLPDIEDQLDAAGLKVAPRLLTDLTEAPMGAIVSLGGCSASFVSPRGLILTNHHCVYGTIQYNSSAEKNLLREGFIARELKDERPASPSARVYVTVEMRDVTDRVVDARTSRLAGDDRMKAIELNRGALVKECERHAGHRCVVSSYYDGLQFRLIKQLEIRDVRLVYAPPESVGKFGGDTDNFSWPRHTGDFAFLRAYVGPDGQPAARQEGNIPYTPRHFLRLANRGPSPGDFVMAVGYPGQTSRHRSPRQVKSAFELKYPEQVRLLEEQLTIIERETMGKPEAKLAYASIVASLNNRLKKARGMLAAYANSDVLSRSEAQWRGLEQWLAEVSGRRKSYGPGLAEVDAAASELQRFEREAQQTELATPRLLEAARVLYRYAQERAKADDVDRAPGFKQRDWPRIRSWLEGIDKRYDEHVDQALVSHFLKAQLGVPARERNRPLLNALGIRDGMSTAGIETTLRRLYGGSQLSNASVRLNWLEQDPKQFQESEDAFIRAARSLYADDLRREASKRELQGRLHKANSEYMKALIAYRDSRGESMYPDANGTLRVSYGQVSGRADGGADGLAWAPFTTLRGLLAKHTGEGEFAVPANQLDAIRSQRWGRYRDEALDSVPVNYLATLDLTGGNSGSAVLDARGELIGLAFDTSLDSVISDWGFNASRTRGIVVDPRYILWQLEVVDRAGELLKELGVQQ